VGHVGAEPSRRVYTLKPAGRKQLSREVKRVGRLIDGLSRVMRPSEASDELIAEGLAPDQARFSGSAT
jgi:hypothetical protein